MKRSASEALCPIPLKRSTSEALCPVEKEAPKSNWQRFPLQLHFSPRIPAERVAALETQIAAVPKIACTADSEDGAVLVLPDFQLEELAALKHKNRVMGLRFVERFLQDPELLSKVNRLPLFDLIYRSPGALCFSAMTEDQRARCQALATWMGASVVEELGPVSRAEPEAALLVAQRVSIKPESKYQRALAMRLPIVRSSYLEAMWEEKCLVDKEPHFLAPLAGLRISFGPIQDQGPAELRKRAAESGAVITTFDAAEVVIVEDSSRPLYQEGRRLGVQMAPPKWLQRCLQIRCCLEIAGDLQVPIPGSAGCEAKMSPILLECVLCLVYVHPGRPREEAQRLAWSCGAWTTLDARDPKITHVLFPKEGVRQVVNVSVPVDEEVEFLDLSWLEDCAAAGKRVKEASYLRQRVAYNPSCDTAFAAALGLGPEGAGSVEAGPAEMQLTETSEASSKTESVKPVASMSGLTIRITALDDTKQGSRERKRLEELVQSLGAKVATNTTRVSQMTHMVCVLPERVDVRTLEAAKKRQVPVVSVQWLLDCSRLGSRQPEAGYATDATSNSAPLAPLQAEGTFEKASACFAGSVLARCELLVSPSALGSEPRLLQMAKELGAASVRTFRSPAELRAALQGAGCAGREKREKEVLVVVEKEEAKQGSLEACSDAWTPELRSLFVQPSWLSETYAQRRRLPLDSFGAFLGAPDAASSVRVAPEAAYAWQPAEMKRLEEVSEQARAREAESKAQQKVSQGLRLAECGC